MRESLDQLARDVMRILLFGEHCYPAFGSQGAGYHPTAYPSGSAHHLHDLIARGLAEEGHKVYYRLAKGASTPLPAGVELIADGYVPDADIWHSASGPPEMANSIAELAKKCKKPYIMTCHMHRPGIGPSPNWVFVSRSLAKTYGADRVVLNGVDGDDYIFEARKQGYFLFMAAMNNALEKGLDIALSLSRRKRVALIVAGTGLNAETVSWVAGLCADAGAEYIGDVRGRRKAEVLANARAVLFPSRLNEGCPLIILEAMFSGTPVISSASGASVEIVTAETGFVCRNDAEWDAAVDRASEINPLRCREIAMEKFHYKRMVSDYVREYQAELGVPAAAQQSSGLP